MKYKEEVKAEDLTKKEIDQPPPGMESGSLNNNDSNWVFKCRSVTPKIARTSPVASKQPSWSQAQLQEAIFAVITQRMRFTQASIKYNIPKGTLYDNILGKSKRLQALEEVKLTANQEVKLLEFCCQISQLPYNRRTSRSLKSIIRYVEKLKQEEEGCQEGRFKLSLRKGFKWWWAFCKKYSIISLYFDKTKEPVDLSKIDLDLDGFEDISMGGERSEEGDAPPPAHNATEGEQQIHERAHGLNLCLRGAITT